MKTYTITVNGNVYDVTVEEKDSTNATSVSAPVVSPKSVTPAKKAEPKATGASGAVKVNSPMPGKILDVKKTAGTNVKKGEVIMVLEAMKMENEIVAPEDGEIASINVSVGDTVEAGAVLATLN